MDWICCLRKKRMQQAYDALRQEPEPPAEPAQYISAGLESEYSLKSTFSSIYKKMSEWSLPKKHHINLFTLNEEEHDFLMNEPGDPVEEETFDDVVDENI